MVNWVRSSDGGPADVVDEPAPLAVAHPDADGTEWLARPHRQPQSPSSAWLVRDEKDDSTRSSRWLIDPPRPSTEPAGVSIAILARRRKRAVEAYCAELCPPALVDRAASDALSAARAAAGGAPTDQQLLNATREVAGEHALAFMRTHANGSGLSEQCQSTPSLLAARAGDRLADGELEQLEHHLAGCLPCQATELRTTRAERMFATAITGADPIEAIAPPTATESAPTTEPAPAPDEPAPLSSSQFLPAAAATATSEQPAAAARPETRRRRRPLWILGALLAGCAAAAILLVALGSGKHATNAPASIRPPGQPTRSSNHHAAARSSKHHAATRHHPAHKAAKPARSKARGTTATSVTTGSTATPSAASAATSAASSTPTSNSAPAAQSSPQPASSGSGAGSGRGSSGSGGGSVAVRQGGLPAQSAPTQGIGSGGSGH